MTKLMRLKHWQAFSIFAIFYAGLLFIQGNDINTNFLSSIELVVGLSIIFLFIFFGWLMSIGVYLTQIKANPDRNRKILILLAGFSTIVGYSLLNLERLSFDEEIVPTWLSIISFPFSYWGIIYIFYKVARSLKSVEIGEKAKFSEYILYIILLAFIPIGIWIIQPKLNKIYLTNESNKDEKK